MNKKLGYYTVGNKQFEKKIEALIYATNIYYLLDKSYNPKSLIHWYFNDEVFNDYNWSIEPEQSLKTLYHQRARQLREQYDYIIISYSGGADSHNIVMSFLDQGLHIDELYVLMMERDTNEWTSIDINNTSSSLSYVSDNYFQTIPRLKEITNRSPNTKIRYLDMADIVFKVFDNFRDPSWVLNMREELNPTDVARYAYSYYPEFKKSLDKYKSVGILLGVDKPKIVVDSNTGLVYLKFVDRLTNVVPIAEYIKEYTNTTTEFFYWNPDACDMLCKQAHTVKRWLENNPGMLRFYASRPSMLMDKNLGNGIDYGRVYTERMLIPVIYDTWDITWFQATKNSRDWFLECDNWFIKGAKGSKEHYTWLEGIKYIINNTKPYIQSPTGFPDSFTPWSKHYCIGKLYN